MSETVKSYHPVNCFSEYDVLKRVIVCQPQYMNIRDIINKTQEHYIEEGIDIERAVDQHNQFISTLREYGVDVHLLPYHKKYPEQVFTRDIGFTLGKLVIVAKMESHVREGEEDVLKQWLEDEEISYYNLLTDHIEGGDVIIDQDTIYIGISHRTNQKAVDHLKMVLPSFDIIPIPFTETYLHLDCVFNVVAPQIALIYSEALTQEDIERFAARYELIEVTKEEQFTLGTNVLAIGNNRILSLPMNKKVNQALRERGFEVIEVDISEIIKSGGSFRCCTLPIVRANH